VGFPLQLDLYEFATDDLRQQLDGPRSTEAAIDDERDTKVKRQKREAVSQSLLSSTMCYHPLLLFAQSDDLERSALPAIHCVILTHCSSQSLLLLQADEADAKAAKAKADKKAGGSGTAKPAEAIAAATAPTVAAVGTGAASDAAAPQVLLWFLPTFRESFYLEYYILLELPLIELYTGLLLNPVPAFCRAATWTWRTPAAQSLSAARRPTSRPSTPARRQVNLGIFIAACFL